MQILGKSGIIPDNEVIFDDGFLWIISREYEDKYNLDLFVLNAEYDDPLNLDDIARMYPNVRKLIYEDALYGCVYNYGNHKDGEKWEMIGELIGYV